MTKFGKLLFTLVIIILAAVAALRVMRGAANDGDSSARHDTAKSSAETAGNASAAAAPSQSGTEAPAEKAFDYLPPGLVPKLSSSQPYRPQDNTVIINISEYAGYAGLILANNGLAPNENSWFTQNGGFKVKITLSEEDSWDDLQAGRIAATATTVDVLSNYGRQWQCSVPLQISWSRGADGLIVRKEIRKINDLAGKRIATAPFSEAEFFIRYLAQEAGLSVKRIDGPDAPADPASVNLVFLEDAFTAGDAFLDDLQNDRGKLAGCVTWAPKTTEVVQSANGKARQLIDNKNLLLIADVLAVNKGFAKDHADKVRVLVEGTMLFNDRIRREPEAHLQAIATAFSQFKWTAATARDELSKVHLSNLPENLAFFEGAIDAAGSFSGVFQSANLAYGSELQPNPVAATYFSDLTVLKAIQQAGKLAGQEASIKPIRSSDQTPIEQDPLLTRDIRFFFMPNDWKLDMAKQENTGFLDSVNRLLNVSPGSMVLLRGHVDNARIQDIRKQGGEALVRKTALKAMELSTQRANEVKSQLLKKHPSIDPARIEVIGRGWEEPAGANPDLNRRVEVQWFTLE